MTRPLAPGYTPLVNALSYRLLRAPLAPWQANQLRNLHALLDAGDPSHQDMAATLNHLAVIEAFRGNYDGAQQLCHGQIAFWRALAVQNGNDACLGAAIQPWINLVRLERWQNNVAAACFQYQEMAPALRHVKGGIGKSWQLPYSLAELSALNQHNNIDNILDNVYWSEYGRLLWNTARYAELQTFLSAGLSQPTSSFVRVVLLELLVLQQVARQHFTSAAGLLKAIRDRLQVVGKYELEFAVLELHLGLCATGELDPERAAEVAKLALLAKHAAHNEVGLTSVMDISRVLRAPGGKDAEAMLLPHALALAEQSNDEVALFQVLMRLQQLGRIGMPALKARFRDSGYAQIRRALGFSGPAPGEEAAQLAIAAVQCLQTLQWDRCRALLAPTREIEFTEM